MSKIDDLKALLVLLKDDNCNKESNSSEFGSEYIGEYVIIRTYSAGVWFGILDQKAKEEVILKEARRMWYWHAKESISLSGVALYGIADDSKIAPTIDSVWLQAIEILSLTPKAIKSIKDAKHVQAS